MLPALLGARGISRALGPSAGRLGAARRDVADALETRLARCRSGARARWSARPPIPVGEDAPEVTPSTPRRAPAPGALTRDGIFAFGILLVVALGLSVALASRSRPRVVLWDDATAYPLAPLAIAPHATADVLRPRAPSPPPRRTRTRRALAPRPRRSRCREAWEDGVFTLNAVRPPRRDEREEISDDDDVDARTNRERRDARAEDRALARWRARDFARAPRRGAPKTPTTPPRVRFV